MKRQNQEEGGGVCVPVVGSFNLPVGILTLHCNNWKRIQHQRAAHLNFFILRFVKIPFKLLLTLKDSNSVSEKLALCAISHKSLTRGSLKSATFNTQTLNTYGLKKVFANNTKPNYI